LDKTDPANVASRLALLPAAAAAAASPSAKQEVKEVKEEVKEVKEEVKEDTSLDIHHASFMVCIGRSMFMVF
jgi:ribosomal protein L12E/L44/L45/RPP1/RPP2